MYINILGLDKVMVVATDKKALGKVEKELAYAGLIISGKVEIVLGYQLNISSIVLRRSKSDCAILPLG